MCYCLGHCPGGHHNGTCLARDGAGCFAAVEEVVLDAGTGELGEERTYGCLPPEDEGGLLQVYCIVDTARKRKKCSSRRTSLNCLR